MTSGKSVACHVTSALDFNKEGCVGINGCMSVNNLWTFIKYQPVYEVCNLDQFNHQRESWNIGE